MKAKLIKTDKDNYILVDSTKGVYDKGYLIGSSRESDVNKLSKQNCDELFGVTDVEKLAMGYDLYEKINFVGQTRAYIAGFNKAMELNKDKVFTLEDMIRISEFVKIIAQSEPHITAKELVSSYVQSLQQPTEIEVQIVTEEFESYDEILNRVKKPILDTEGCLILKKK
jgi:hypothetical protein